MFIVERPAQSVHAGVSDPVFFQAGQFHHVPRLKLEAARAGDGGGMVTSLWVRAYRACHCPLPRRKVWAAVSPGLPEGPLTEARAL